MIIIDNILMPENPNNWLVNYELKVFGKKVRLGSVGKIEDWSELTPEEKERLEKEWNPQEGDDLNVE